MEFYCIWLSQGDTLFGPVLLRDGILLYTVVTHNVNCIQSGAEKSEPPANLQI